MKALFVLLFLALSLAAQPDLNVDDNLTEAAKVEAIQKAKESLKEIEKDLSKNIWIKHYNNYVTYGVLHNELKAIESKIKRSSGRELEELKKKREMLKSKISLLEDYKESPFGELIKPAEFTDVPTVNNPIAIIGALSYMRQINDQKDNYTATYEELTLLIEKLKEKRSILEELVVLTQAEEYQNELNKTIDEISAFESAIEIFKTTVNVYSKKAEEITLKLTKEIKEQGKKALSILTVVAILVILSILVKLVIHRTIKDHERYYMANKIINFLYVTAIIIVVLFAYIENVSYIVTVLGFASAGIAIAMKDWFMSILGWLVIVIGGSIQVGDRIRVKKDGVVYVGDVLDISLLRITIYEDVTLTTYLENKRAGRIIFIPNNYVFTTLIANYTHGGLKTVWDGIEITLSFDSNYKKAVSIIREITKKYSKGYTDITRKHLSHLRSRYSFKVSNIEPRIFTFIEPSGMKISIWYLTNSYATLALRSTISAEIVEQLLKEEDIKIVYHVIQTAPYGKGNEASEQLLMG